MRSTSNIRNLVYIALFAALFIVMSSLEIKLGLPVPITLQTLAVMLAGAFLSPRNSFLALLLVIALTATGLPLLHGKGGLPYILGPTGGFIFSFPVCALLIGLAARRLYTSRYLSSRRTASLIAFFALFLLASLFIYIPGVAWLKHAANLSFDKALAGGFYPFIPGDTIKSAVAALLVVSLKGSIVRLQGLTSDDSASTPVSAGK
ncbi:biotin transporter BioY [Paenibacillus sp. NPDC058071]|uniref:biotin transporter BioY n=1 Tax=Paenibacillus sp. NPDC058071 TaxID=3346326 RepID=UPI0036DAE1CB